MYDAIVVGARCAGASTALLLARRGRRVLLVDRTTFPSDTLSGHTIQPFGVAALRRWGLLDRVRATGTPFISTVRFDVGPIVLEGSPAPVEGISDAVCIRRTVFDTLLVDAAREAGAEVREGFTLTGVCWDGDRVTGIRGRNADGIVVEERARLVVGADGVHSTVARQVGAPTYDEQPHTAVSAYTYFAGVPVQSCEIYVRPDRFIVATPTNDGLTLIAQCITARDEHAYRDDVDGEFRRTLELAPDLAARVAAGHRVERYRFTDATRGFFRQASGPGWALVGDAGYHKDPITAQGMGDAFVDAESLATAVDMAIDADLDGELVRWGEARDARVKPMYDFTCQLSDVAAPPPAEMLELFGALAGNPAETARFLGLIGGGTRVEEFLAPDNVARICREAKAAV
jgi:2-polyprenyl-6-methoxyphenol hydroxylase-like FAD-dependent oxidoreductase